MDTLERRSGWLLLAIAVVLVWNSLVGGGFAALRTWELVVVLTSLFCLALAALLVVGALAAGPGLLLDRRQRWVSLALVLFGLALVLISVRSASFAYDLHERGGLGLGE
jgi:hypothetical protein